MHQNPEQRDLIDLMLGHHVAIKHVSGPDITDENFHGVVEEGRVLKGPPEARTTAFYLRAYSSFGIEVTKEAERGNEILIPWGAVLAIQGPSRESLERNAREATEQSGVDNPPRNRQELMNQLGNARTSSEIANAKAAADSWLATHPGDGDVRLAREQLQTSYPEDLNLEEGSPT